MREAISLSQYVLCCNCYLLPFTLLDLLDRMSHLLVCDGSVLVLALLSPVIDVATLQQVSRVTYDSPVYWGLTPSDKK